MCFLSHLLQSAASFLVILDVLSNQDRGWKSSYEKQIVLDKDIASLKVTICFPIHKPVYCPLSSVIEIRKQGGLGLLEFFITSLIALIPCHWTAVLQFGLLAACELRGSPLV